MSTSDPAFPAVKVPNTSLSPEPSAVKVERIKAEARTDIVAVATLGLLLATKTCPVGYEPMCIMAIVVIGGGAGLLEALQAFGKMRGRGGLLLPLAMTAGKIIGVGLGAKIGGA
jgi:hypothetical protein